jgi:hypothetical protein
MSKDTKKWGGVSVSPASPISLPPPDHPSLGLPDVALDQAAQDEYDGLIRGYWRFCEWQAELVNRDNREDSQVYCEELEKWRRRVSEFRRRLQEAH